MYCAVYPAVWYCIELVVTTAQHAMCRPPTPTPSESDSDDTLREGIEYLPGELCTDSEDELADQDGPAQDGAENVFL